MAREREKIRNNDSSHLNKNSIMYFQVKLQCIRLKEAHSWQEFLGLPPSLSRYLIHRVSSSVEDWFMCFSKTDKIPFRFPYHFNHLISEHKTTWMAPVDQNLKCYLSSEDECHLQSQLNLDLNSMVHVYMLSCSSPAVPTQEGKEKSVVVITVPDFITT